MRIRTLVVALALACTFAATMEAKSKHSRKKPDYRVHKYNSKPRKIKRHA